MHFYIPSELSELFSLPEIKSTSTFEQMAA